MRRAWFEKQFQPSPRAGGRWLYRPFGSLPLVLELPDDAARERVIRWNTRNARLTLPATIAVVLLFIYTPFWVPLLAMALLPVLEYALLSRGAARVPKDLWQGPAVVDQKKMLPPGYHLTMLIIGMVLMLFWLASVLPLLLRFELNLSMAVLLSGVGLLIGGGNYLTWRRWRASR